MDNQHPYRVPMYATEPDLHVEALIGAHEEAGDIMLAETRAELEQLRDFAAREERHAEEMQGKSQDGSRLAYQYEGIAAGYHAMQTEIANRLAKED